MKRVIAIAVTLELLVCPGAEASDSYGYNRDQMLGEPGSFRRDYLDNYAFPLTRQMAQSGHLQLGEHVVVMIGGIALQR